PTSRLPSLSRVRDPPLRPVFPYTTLFRSVEELARAVGSTIVLSSQTSILQTRRRTLPPAQPQPSPISPTTCGLGPRPSQRRARGDRKSTRLNSSHVTISYAVFCLKKQTWS